MIGGRSSLNSSPNGLAPRVCSEEHLQGDGAAANHAWPVTWKGTLVACDTPPKLLVAVMVYQP